MKRKTSTLQATRARYDRLAFFYDFMEAPVEWWRFGPWRSRLKDAITGSRALEVGIGTGKNMPYHPRDSKVAGIDVSERMLKRAVKRTARLGRDIELLEMDVQQLAFADHSFDTVFATFVFCSVPDPVQGLRELRRVCKPAGKLFLLEHMRPGNPFLGFVFDLLNPLVVRMMGANINRKTVDNIVTAGWRVTREECLSSDIVRWIEAEP